MQTPQFRRNWANKRTGGEEAPQISRLDSKPMKQRNLLLVDDEDDLREALAEQFELSNEFMVTHARNAHEAMRVVAEAAPEIVIMDVGLPDMDGREAVKAMRRGGFKRPIIMLSGKDSEADMVVGLDAGAHDYVAKPFRFVELLARVRAQLRLLDASDDAEFALGPYTFHPAQKRLAGPQGRDVRLTEKETAILRFLLKADHRPVGREILLRDVWGYNAAVDTHTLETHIYRLRQKIENDGDAGKIILTDPEGYRLAP